MIMLWTIFVNTNEQTVSRPTHHNMCALKRWRVWDETLNARSGKPILPLFPRSNLFCRHDWMIGFLLGRVLERYS
jgi:hypothetical protein